MRYPTAARLGIGTCLVILAACGSSPPTTTPARSASSFVEALNAKNISGMLELSGRPFRFRSQAWESAPDGSGYVLGAATEQAAADPVELDALLREVAATVRVADTTVVGDPPSKAELLNDTLRGAPPPWADLDLVPFRRGEGDIEHIAIVGIEPESGKVVGLYVN